MRQFFAKLSFSTQLLIAFVMIFLFTGILLNSINNFFQNQYFKRLIKEEIQFTREMLIPSLTTFIINEEFDKAEKYLYSMMNSISQIKKVELIQPNGQVIMSLQSQDSIVRINYPIRRFEHNLSETIQEFDEHYHVVFPIRVSTQAPPLAWIALDYSNRAFSEIQKKGIWTNVVTILSGLLFTFLILGLLFREFNREMSIFLNFLRNIPNRKGKLLSNQFHSKELFILQDTGNRISTILKQQEEEIIKEKNKLERIQNVIKEGIILVDRELRILHTNRATFQILESSKIEEALNSKIYEFIPLYDEGTHRSLWEITLIPLVATYPERENHFPIIEGILELEDGRKKNIEISFVPINLERDRQGFVFVLRDITEKKRLQKEITNIEKFDAVNRLAGGIAHDLNNFLASLYNHINLIRMRLSSKGEEFLEDKFEKIESILQKATYLAHQLLSMSKGGAPIKKPENIVELIREVADFCFSGSQITFELIEEGDIKRFLFDANQLAQVFQNLFINARDAMPEGGKVTVRLRLIELPDRETEPVRAHKFIEIEVSDTGPGIPKDILNRIFDPFYTTKEHGSGLGLSIVSQIVQNHGGTISVESKLGEGTTFRIRLPYEEREVYEEKVGEELLIPSSELKILLVDDEPDVIEPLSILLSDLGYRVETANSVSEALLLFENALSSGEPFDIIITDYTMPELTGDKLVSRLKDIYPKFKAIISSGYTDIPVATNYEDYGFDGVLQKPYTIEEFMRVLDSVVSRITRDSKN